MELGRVENSSAPHQNDRRAQRDPGHETCKRFLIARSNPAQWLDFVEKSLDPIAVLVARLVVVGKPFSGRAAWNDGHGTLRLNISPECVTVISLISKNIMRPLAFPSPFGLRPLVGGPLGHAEFYWIAWCIDDRVNLAAQTAAPAPKTFLLRAVALFGGVPAACGCARTMVASRILSSRLAAMESNLNTVSPMPWSAPLRNRFQTLCQCPKRSGQSRQGAPVLAIQITASTNCRLSWAGCPTVPNRPGH